MFTKQQLDHAYRTLCKLDHKYGYDENRRKGWHSYGIGTSYLAATLGYCRDDAIALFDALAADGRCYRSPDGGRVPRWIPVVAYEG